MESRRVATLTQVAQRAGVSLTTASKAINGQPRVSAEARARVLKAAAELSFTPNPMARSLLTGRSGIVALLILDRYSQRWAVPAILGAESALQRVELAMVVSSADGDGERMRELARMHQARKVDGLLVLGDNNVLTPSLRDVVSLPVVYLNGETGDPRDVCHVPDDRDGARLALEHLHALGRRRVVHVTGPEGVRAVAERAAGARAEAERAGIPLLPGIRYGQWSQRWGREAVERVLREQPEVDAVLCGSDQIAYGAVTALQAAGRRVPEDVAVTGYDDWDAFALETDPALTTVDLRLDVLGEAAVRDLSALVDGGGPGVGGGVRTHACALVPRGSTDPALAVARTASR